MRSLSEDEKLVICGLIKGKNSISDLFDFTNYEGYLIEYKIEPYSGKKKIKILVNSSIEMNDALDRFVSLQINLARTLNIVDYLIKENYLFVINLAHGQSVQGRMGSQNELARFKENSNLYSTEIPIPENFIIPAIISLIDKQIIYTKALEEYFENNFKTKDEIHNQKTQLISVVALITAIVIGTASIIVSICD